MFPWTVKVGVSDANKNPLGQVCASGGLPRLSPEEPIHALILAIADAIKRDDPDLVAWRSCLLNTPMEFVLCKTENDRMWDRINSREKIAIDCEIFARSATSRVFEVVLISQTMQQQGHAPPTARAVADAWKEHVAQSQTQEAVNFSFVDTAMTVHRRVFGVPEALSAILWCEDMWGPKSPWNSLYKIEALCRKIGTHGDSSKLVWMIEGVCNMVFSRQHQCEDFTLSKLTGKGTSNRGILDLLLLKKNVLQHMRDITLTSLRLPEPVMERIQNATHDHCSYW